MNSYELMLLIDSKISDDDVNNLLSQAETLIKEKKGEIIETVHWGRKKLAYSINKDKDAYYVLVNFKLVSQNLKEIVPFYKLNEKIIRYFILKK